MKKILFRTLAVTLPLLGLGAVPLAAYNGWQTGATIVWAQLLISALVVCAIGAIMLFHLGRVLSTNGMKRIEAAGRAYALVRPSALLLLWTVIVSALIVGGTQQLYAENLPITVWDPPKAVIAFNQDGSAAYAIEPHQWYCKSPSLTYLTMPESSWYSESKHTVYDNFIRVEVHHDTPEHSSAQEVLEAAQAGKLTLDKRLVPFRHREYEDDDYLEKRITQAFDALPEGKRTFERWEKELLRFLKSEFGDVVSVKLIPLT